MNKRKILGTILGAIMYGVCILYFTYAYYVWRSEETPLSFGIEDLVIDFDIGPNVDVNNIGPVLDYNDGVSTEFIATNNTDFNIPTTISLDITFISENLKTKDFKYILLRDTSGGNNYTEKIASGNFYNFNTESTNTIIDCELVNAKSTYSYKFIVYIDGNVKNNINMQNNRLESVLVLEDSEISYMTTFTSDTDYSYYRSDTYRESIKNIYFVDYINTEGVSASWDMTDLDNDDSGSVMSWVVPNETDSTYYDLYIGAEELIVGTDLSYLFMGLTNVESINFGNFSTTISTNMSEMFANCNNLGTLDLNSFNTLNVTNMYGMFGGVGINSTNFLLNLGDKFDTSNVTNMSGMFSGVGMNSTNLTLNLGDKFDTSNVTNMSGMFFGVGMNGTNLTFNLGNKFDTSNVTDMSLMFAFAGSNTSNFTLELGNKFDTSGVTNMTQMFQNCISLTTTITIKNVNTTTYTDMFDGAAANAGASITVNYTADTSSLVDSMIATKSGGSNVVKGSLVSD